MILNDRPLVVCPLEMQESTNIWRIILFNTLSTFFTLYTIYLTLYTYVHIYEYIFMTFSMNVIWEDFSNFYSWFPSCLNFAVVNRLQLWIKTDWLAQLMNHRIIIRCHRNLSLISAPFFFQWGNRWLFARSATLTLCNYEADQAKFVRPPLAFLPIFTRSRADFLTTIGNVVALVYSFLFSKESIDVKQNIFKSPSKSTYKELRDLIESNKRVLIYRQISQFNHQL